MNFSKSQVSFDYWKSLEQLGYTVPEGHFAIITKNNQDLDMKYSG